MADYKAKIDFSFSTHAYKAGDAIKETDETAIAKLVERGLIVEGKGKEQPAPEGESMKEKVQQRLDAGAEAEKVKDAAAVSKAVKTKAGLPAKKKGGK
jgi:hypothetical protein